MQAMLDFTARQEYTTSTYSDYIRDRDGELLAYLKENAGGDCDLSVSFDRYSFKSLCGDEYSIEGWAAG